MAKADKPEKNNKQKHFWKDFKAELKKVIWPTRSQVINNTIIVVVIVLIVTAICFVLDLAFEALNTYGIDKLKSLVQSNVTNTVDENTVDENTVSEDETSNGENSEENSEENNEQNPDENGAEGNQESDNPEEKTTDIPEASE